MRTRFANAWRAIRHSVLNPGAAPTPDLEVAALAREQAPVLWLLGKVQSGKTSIIRAITGNPAAHIGRGFKPCTRFARVYDFPADAPVIRFLDTRGLADANYDPGEDLTQIEQRSHLLLAVCRAMDPDQAVVLDVLRTVRERHPDWAIVLVQTTLHEGYPEGADHPPYDDLFRVPELADLRRSLLQQAKAFRELPGNGPLHAVQVDFTGPAEGFSKPLYGLDALIEALEKSGSAGMQTVLQEIGTSIIDERARRARPHTLGYATAAATSDLVPVVGLVTVPTIQGKLLHSLGRIYGITWSRKLLRDFAASLGTGTVLGMGIKLSLRQLAKLVPVYGQSVAAAAAAVTSFAVTYALGRAACYYLGEVRTGTAERDEVVRVYRESLREALQMARQREISVGSKNAKAGSQQ